MENTTLLSMVCDWLVVAENGVNMTTLRRWLLISAAVCLCRAAIALVICGACGHEVADGKRFCGHCGAKTGDIVAAPEVLPEPALAADRQTAANGIVIQAFLDAAREDSRSAAELEEQQPELALYYYRNAAALSRLVPDDHLPPDAGKKLVEAVERCQRRMSRTLKPCVVCAGTGRRTLLMQALGMGNDGDTQILRGQGLTCTACGGAGAIQTQRNADELRLVLAQGIRSHELRQQTARRVAVGNAWVPGSEADKLTPRQQALLRTATAAPCTDCQGLGVQLCRSCKGQGRRPCRERGCINGVVERKSANTLTSVTALTLKTKCPACNGDGWTPCPDCAASGHVVCRACDGLGRPAKCIKCGGAGTAPCTVCKGTGKERSGNPCAACMGEGIGLCRSCHGEGCAAK